MDLSTMAGNEYPLSAGALFVPIAAGSVIVLDIAPLVWHLRNANIGAASLVIWLLIFNLFAFTNALIWPRDNTQQWFSGNGLCDFETFIIVAGWVGVPSCLLCVMRSLAHVLDTSKVTVNLPRAHRLRQFAIDCLICWAPAIVQLGLYDVVRTRRYAIKGFNGCMPTMDTSWVSLTLIYIWPLLIGLVTGYYAVLVIVRLQRYRTEVSQLIQAHKTTLSRFVRLFLLSSLFLLTILPSQSIILYINSLHQEAIQYSWSRTHNPVYRSRIELYPAKGALIPDRWVGIICGLLLFLFFGLGADAAAMYRSWWAKLTFLPFLGRGHRSSSSNSSPSSPSRSVFSSKTYLTTSTAKSLFKPPFTFWRRSSRTAVLPTHNNNRVSAAPTIETAISTTPLSCAIRKASDAIFTSEDLDDGVTLLGSPTLGEKMAETGLGIQLGAVGPKAVEW